jgi:hypothetical protein
MVTTEFVETKKTFNILGSALSKAEGIHCRNTYAWYPDYSPYEKGTCLRAGCRGPEKPSGTVILRYEGESVNDPQMDVTSFLLISVICCTLQLHDSLRVDSRGAYALSAVKLATMLELYYRREASVVGFLWAKGLNAKVIHKEMFSCLCCEVCVA